MSETNEKKVNPVYERVFRDVQDKNLRKAYIYLLSKEGKKDLAVYDKLGIKNDPSQIYYVQAPNQWELYKFIMYFYEVHKDKNNVHMIPMITYLRDFKNAELQTDLEEKMNLTAGFGRFSVIYIPKGHAIGGTDAFHASLVIDYAKTRVRKNQLTLIAAEYNIPEFTEDPEIKHIQLFHRVQETVKKVNKTTSTRLVSTSGVTEVEGQ